MAPGFLPSPESLLQSQTNPGFAHHGTVTARALARGRSQNSSPHTFLRPRVRAGLDPLLIRGGAWGCLSDPLLTVRGAWLVPWPLWQKGRWLSLWGSV